MEPISRRSFSATALRSLLGYALADTLVACARDDGSLPRATRDDASDASTRVTSASGYDLEAMAAWLQQIQTLGEDVKRGALAQNDWTVAMEAMLGALDVGELLRFLDFERFARDLQLAEVGAAKKQIVFPDAAGLPSEIAFVRQVFALGAGRAIVPHGHDNMVSSFLVIGGEFRGRHFERLATDDAHMRIAPSIDRTFVVGDISTLSDDHDNVHWYLAQRSPSYLFNLHVRGVDPNNPDASGRVYVDPDGEELADGTIRARRISGDEAHALYG